MSGVSRRELLGAAAVAGLAALGRRASAFVPAPPEVPAGDRPAPRDRAVEVLHPRGRVPLSFIIDDSTCLVNMGRFCMPQFRAAWPQNFEYRKAWKDWPAEIPDDFVREFADFCGAEGVRGKYSLVPYPACVGWLDRELPGWSRQDLNASLKLVREVIAPSWDITPEMVTHTRVIDLKTGRPIEPPGPATMENSYPPKKQSADELAAYLAYALEILRNCEIPCSGVTTPGGFGNACKAELSLAVRQAVTDVYRAEIPFYFKYIADGAEPTHPRLEHVERRGGGGGGPNLVVNVPAGTGDMFGGWDGSRPPSGEKYATDDASAGRMVELIERGEPAVLFGHWAGLYSNGTKRGFEACKRVIKALNGRYGERTIWMKASELARYQAARELTGIAREGGQVTLSAPFACPAFTVRIARDGGAPAGAPQVKRGDGGVPVAMKEVAALRDVAAGTWLRQGDGGVLVCFDLEKGRTVVRG